MVHQVLRYTRGYIDWGGDSRLSSFLLSIKRGRQFSKRLPLANPDTFSRRELVYHPSCRLLLLWLKLQGSPDRDHLILWIRFAFMYSLAFLLH